MSEDSTKHVAAGSRVISLYDKTRQLVVELSMVRNAQERFSRVIERGRLQPPLGADLKTDAHRVQGCLSKLWIVAEFRDGKCYFRADSDSQIVRAIASLLCEIYSGYPPNEVLATDPSFLSEVGISQHLTPNRRNALSRVWENIRDFARRHQEPPNRSESHATPSV